jgi:hypothetical protein
MGSYDGVEAKRDCHCTSTVRVAAAAASWAGGLDHRCVDGRDGELDWLEQLRCLVETRNRCAGERGDKAARPLSAQTLRPLRPQSAPTRIFPNGIPARVEVIEVLNGWLEEAERLRPNGLKRARCRSQSGATESRRVQADAYSHW